MGEVSLEIFPCRSGDDTSALDAADALAAGEARFVSVTCTSGDFARTIRLCVELGNRSHVPAAHMLCGGRSRAEVGAMVDECERVGVRKVVALRGDLPVAGATNPLAGTHELVAILAERGCFDEIMVGGYPDKHPESASELSGMSYLRKKVEAGAHRVITQFCFEPDKLERFRDDMNAAGIRARVSAGLLPVRNFAKMCLFAERCQTRVPEKLRQLFTGASRQKTEELAFELVCSMTAELLVRDFDIHYYTLNARSLIGRVWAAAGSAPDDASRSLVTRRS